MSDQEYIDSVKRGLTETIDFFNPARRQEREIWVANEFLTNLGISFEANELITPDNDPPDIIFRDAQFEIKEILDPNRRRHSEYKAALKSAEKATSMKDLIEEYSPRDITYSEIYELVKESVQKYVTKYPSQVRNGLDLLFYINLEDTRAYIKHDLPHQEALMDTGFRSISFISGYLSGVLMTQATAPKLLQGSTSKVIKRGSTL